VFEFTTFFILSFLITIKSCYAFHKTIITSSKDARTLKLYNKMFSRGIEPQSMNGFCPITIEGVLCFVITTHETQESKCIFVLGKCLKYTYTPTNNASIFTNMGRLERVRPTRLVM